MMLDNPFLYIYVAAPLVFAAASIAFLAEPARRRVLRALAIIVAVIGAVFSLLLTFAFFNTVMPLPVAFDAAAFNVGLAWIVTVLLLLAGPPKS